MENKEWERFGLQAQVPFFHTHDVMTVTGNEYTPCETTFRSHPGINVNDLSSSDDRYLLWSASLPPAARVGGHVQRPPLLGSSGTRRELGDRCLTALTTSMKNGVERIKFTARRAKNLLEM